MTGTPVARAWTAEFFRDADTLDMDQLAPWFADDVQVRFGNAPPANGKAEAVAGLQRFWTMITKMRHIPALLLGDDDNVVQLATVTYTDLGGREVSLPVASHLRRSGDRRIDRLWVYIDLAPLFATP